MPVLDIEYIKDDSVVHRLHPFVLIVFELAVFVIAGTLSHPVHLAGFLLLLIGVARLARLPVGRFRYLWVVGAVMVIFVLTQGVWFTSFGDFGERAIRTHVLFHVWPAWAPGGPRVPFVLEGAVYGLALGLRFLAIAFAFPLLVMTVHPRDLITALARIRIGTHRLPYELIFVFANALRYVPMISRRFDETMDAQRTRGAEFEGRHLVRRIRASVPLLVPVVTSSLVHAQDLTLALETRAFGARRERTFARELILRPVDVVVMTGLVVLAAACVLTTRRYGWGVLRF